jgi:hypothetical protein
MSALPKTVLAIDPGTAKHGMALVRRDGDDRTKALWHAIVAPEHLIPKLHEAYSVAPFVLIIVGAGTGSAAALHTIREHLPSMATLVVDETNTTLHARERYWENNPRRGWRRFLPATLQVPPEPVDAFVAQILAERVLL